MKMARLGSVAAMGIAAIGFAAVPAYADGITYSASGGASAGWLSDGDKTVTCDEKKDGYAAVTRIWVIGENPEDQGSDWATGGVGDCVTTPRSWIREGATVRLQACLGKNDQILKDTCGPVRSDRA
ncbi:hypothetical protein QFZ55_001506 [Streptomyces luteogriseus]|nr:hypothetical protein [Streptomyces luteogriseus]